MKYILVAILVVLGVWSMVAWRITPETRARQHVVVLSLAPPDRWRNLPKVSKPPLVARIDSVCGRRPVARDGLHLVVLAGEAGYDRAALCRGRDFRNAFAETGVSSRQWTLPFQLDLEGPDGTTSLDWRMNLRTLADDASRVLVYLRHVFEAESRRPLQQAMFHGVDRPRDWRVSLYRMTDPHPQRRFELAAFNRWFPECYLRLVAVDRKSGGVQQVIVQTCSKVGPNIIDVYGLRQLQMYVNTGILRDLTEDAQRMGFSLDRTYAKLAPALCIDGRQYCYPCNVNIRILFYNKNLFDRYDVEYPPTHRIIDWLEFVREYAEPLTIRRPGRSVPLHFGLTLDGYEHFIYQAGGQLYTPDGTRAAIDSPEAIAGLRMYQDLMHKYNVMPNPSQKVNMSGQGGYSWVWMNWFGAQKIACIRVGKWALNTFRRYIAEQRRRFAKRFPDAVIPTDPKELRAWTKQWMIDHPDPVDWPPLRLGATFVPRMPGCEPTYLMDHKSAAIPVRRLNPKVDHALDFLRFLTGEEYCQIINDGADSLPGNPKYATLERQIHPEWPEERDIHHLTNEATKWGYVRQVSPFADELVTERILYMQVQRLETDPDFTAAEAARIAAKDINDAIQRSLRDNPTLRARYEKLVGQRQEGLTPAGDTARRAAAPKTIPSGGEEREFTRQTDPGSGQKPKRRLDAPPHREPPQTARGFREMPTQSTTRTAALHGALRQPTARHRQDGWPIASAMGDTNSSAKACMSRASSRSGVETPHRTGAAR